MPAPPKPSLPRVLTRGGRIGRRVTALVAIAVLISVSVIASVFVWLQASNTISQRRATLEATAYVFASAVAGDVAGRDIQAIYGALRSISRLPNITYVVVTDTKGRELASMGSTVLLQDGGSVSLFTSSAFPVAVDIVKAGEPIAKLIMVADVSDLRAAAIMSMVYAFLAALAASGIGMLVALRLQRRITDPILSLTGAMQEVRDTKNFAAQVTAQSDDEVGQLVDTFNSMLSEINTRDTDLAQHRRDLEATVERRTHELSLAKDAAESANRAKSGFLATMSHEIRTPMNGLMVMAELLAAGGLDRRQQRYAEVIVKSGQSLLTIINDILDLSKIEAGRLELERIEVDPVLIADDVVSLFWERATSKGLDLAARVQANVPRRVLADPVRLNQILSNLVNNALKFTEKGQVLVSLSHDSGHLHLTVTDSGIGIPKDKIGHLFGAFSQADQSITRRFGGTGLGLAICKKLTDAMGGTIAVASEPGRGSSFRVSIPAEPEATRTAPAGAGRAAVMIAGLASRAAVASALTNAGYAVEAANGFSEGPRVFFIEAAKLATLDLPKQRSARIICLCPMGDTSGEHALIAGSADDLVTLPLRHADLDEVLTGLANGTLRGRALVGARTAPRKIESSFNGRRILVADDNAVNREVLIEVLRQLGVVIETAADGREAIAKWRALKPDLVFMDCSMPVMDGFAATREIRAHERLDVVERHTPIVALTAHIAGGTGEEWRQAGMDAYMTKPFTVNSIVRCLESYLAAGPVTPLQTPPQAASGNILDEDVLSEIMKIGGNDALYRRVLDIFAAKAPAVMQTIDDVRGRGDRKALADAAHALKSMCANIGALQAMNACNDLEYSARQAGPFDANEKFAAIAKAMKLALGEVERRRSA